MPPPTTLRHIPQSNKRNRFNENAIESFIAPKVIYQRDNGQHAKVLKALQPTPALIQIGPPATKSRIVSNRLRNLRKKIRRIGLVIVCGGEGKTVFIALKDRAQRIQSVDDFCGGQD